MRRLIYILPILFTMACSNQQKEEIPVTEVKRGVFYVDIHEEGELKSTRSTSITTPSVNWRYDNLKIAQLVADGTEVEAGDTVVVFDPSGVNKAIIEAETRLEQRQAELERLQAQQESDMAGLLADFEVTRIGQEISKIQFESASYEAEIKRKEIELNLKKANISLERAQEQIENKKKIQQEEIKQKQLEITQAKSELDDAKATLNNLSLVSPSPGFAILATNWSSGAKYQVGDQPYTSYPIVDLPDLSELKASVQINEVDISKIKKGLKVEIKPDAFTDSVYYGEVSEVANLAVNKQRSSKIKVFPVDIVIKNSGKTLLPGLTVSCRIIIDQIDDVLYAPLDAVYKSVEGDYVYIKKGTGFEKKIVQLGKTNTDFVLIESGLNEGDELAMIDPTKIDEENESDGQQNN